jgi:putative FmdB family regulatory protein
LPIYEYRCGDCGHRYERREGFEAPPLQACPHCGGSARRVLHAPPIVFKGSGFYSTDHRPTRFGPNGNEEKASEEKASEPPSSSSKDSEALAAS